MISARYRKLTGMHAGHSYVVMVPASEIDSPMRWTIQCETVADEDELSDPKRWQPLG